MVFLESTAGGVPPEEVLALLNVLENHDYGDKTVAALLSIMEKSGRHIFDAYHQASKLLARELKFKEGENGILVNGRVSEFCLKMRKQLALTVMFRSLDPFILAASLRKTFPASPRTSPLSVLSQLSPPWVNLSPSF